MSYVSPCRHCENVGCGAYHEQCELYQEYHKNLEERNARRFKETQHRWYVLESQNKVLKKYRYSSEKHKIYK